MTTSRRENPFRRALVGFFSKEAKRS